MSNFIFFSFIITLACSRFIYCASELTSSSLGDQRTCEPIKIESCRGLGYNATGMPNLVGNELQQDAEMQYNTFNALIQYGCSSRLKFFLCSVYTPMCTEKVAQPIGPCRSLCEAVKSRCNSVIEEFGFFWPSALNCSKFPVSNTQETMCMEGPKDDDEDLWPPEESPKPIPKPNRHYGFCRQYKFSDRYLFINRTQRCAHDCDADILFSSYDKAFSTKWIASWSIVCFVASVATLVGYFRSSQTEPSLLPEKILIILAANYSIYSSAFIIGLLLGRNDTICQIESQYQSPVLIQEGLDKITCTVTFVLSYFFANSCMIWWAILAICIFSLKILHKSPQQIEKMRSLFHLVAWTLPAIQTTLILVARLPDGDEFSGICYVGSQRTDTLLIFVIMPSALYLLICLLFQSLAAFWSKNSSRHLHENSLCLKNRTCSNCSFVSHATHGTHGTSMHLIASPVHPGQERLESMIAQLSIFAFFYFVTATCVLAANIYEYLQRDTWYSSGSGKVPNAEIFVLKAFMSLIVGLLILASRFLPQSRKLRLKSEVPALVTPSGLVLASRNLPSRGLSTIAPHSATGSLLSRPLSKLSQTSSYTPPFDVTYADDLYNLSMGRRSRLKPETTV